MTKSAPGNRVLRSEPSEQQPTSEAFLASRRSMHSPTSRAISAITAFPSTREALWSAGKARCASRLTAQNLVKALPPGFREPSGRGAHRSVTVHEANEELPHGAVDRDDGRWQVKMCQVDEAPALIYVRSRGKASHVFINPSARPAPVDTNLRTLRDLLAGFHGTHLQTQLKCNSFALFQLKGPLLMVPFSCAILSDL